MEIKSTREMINYRNYLLTKLNIEYDKLDQINNNPYVKRKDKKAIRKSIDIYKAGLNHIEKIMRNGAEFKTEDFASFLEKFLAITDSDIKITKIKVADEILEERLYQKIRIERMLKKSDRINNVNGRWCYFVSNEDQQEFILNNIFDDYDLDYHKNGEILNNVLILDEYTTYPFYNFQIKNEFLRYKRLKTAIYELIDLKLKNPNLTDKERLEIVLENTKNRKTSYQKQKKSN